MHKNAMLLLTRETTQRWEILFTPLQDLCEAIGNDAGIPAFFHANIENWQKTVETLPGADHVFLWEAEHAYVTAEEITAALVYHKQNNKDITTALFYHEQSNKGVTLLQDKQGRSGLTGWYTRDSLGRDIPQRDSFTVENLTAVNTRKELAQVNTLWRQRMLEKHWENGVNIPFPEGVIISPVATIAPNATILQGTVLKGNTTIAGGCEIGPNSQLTNAVVGEGTRIHSSVVTDSTLQQGVSVGPMAQIRPDCVIGDRTKIGDFVELKNATIGTDNSIAHLSYLGDCTIGSFCNFGCGTTIVNFDGTTKTHTVIGNSVFIGCNCSLVSPVNIGDGAYAAAGSTITDDVPSGALVIARARQTIKEDWSTKRGLYQRGQTQK